MWHKLKKTFYCDYYQRQINNYFSELVLNLKYKKEKENIVLDANFTHSKI